jgi:hypothetical protein
MDGAAPKKSLQSLLNGFISKKAKTVAAVKPPAPPAPPPGRPPGPPPGPPPNALKRRRLDGDAGDGNAPRTMAPSRNLHVSNLSPSTTER